MSSYGSLTSFSRECAGILLRCLPYSLAYPVARLFRYPFVSILEGGFAALKRLLDDETSPFDPSSALVPFEVHRNSEDERALDLSESNVCTGSRGEPAGGGANSGGGNLSQMMSSTLGSSKSWLSGAAKSTPLVGLGGMKVRLDSCKR